MMVESKIGRVALVLSGCLLLFVGSCQRSSGGGGGGAAVSTAPVTEVRRYSLSANGTVDNVPLTAGVTTHLEFVSDFPSDGPFVDVAVNVPDTFSMITVDPSVVPLIGGAGVTGTAEVTIRIGLLEQVDTCTNGYHIATFTLPMDGGPAGFDRVDAEPSSVNLINTGQYTVCVSITPTENGLLTVPAVEFDVTDCLTPPVDISGEWTGPFNCTEECTLTPFGGQATIFIEQDGMNARYTDDSGGEFHGTVCGDRFQFSGGYVCTEVLTCEEIESGTFLRRDGNNATKTSRYTYLDLGGSECSGDCSDTLSRSGSSRVSGAYDVDFEDTDWELDSVVVVVSSGSINASQQMISFRETTYSSTSPGTARAFHRSLERSYTPATQGAIDFLEIRWQSDLRVGSEGGSVLERPALFQEQPDGTLRAYELDLSFAQNATPGWSDVDFGTGLSAIFFHSPGGVDAPNFAGSTIWFGYVTDFDLTSGSTLNHGLDDFSVIVHRTP